MQILDAEQVHMKLSRIAYEIIENNLDCKVLTLAGIAENGVIIARLLKDNIEKILVPPHAGSKIKVELITIHINKQNPVECSLDKDFDPKGKDIIIVDDVASSGKTMMYALKPFLSTISSRIQVMVLVDRKHKKFPITSDYVGMQLSTTLQENIIVECKNEKILGAYID